MAAVGLDVRLAQAHGGELDHLNFLQVLCQDEMTDEARGRETRSPTLNRRSRMASGHTGEARRRGMCLGTDFPLTRQG